MKLKILHISDTHQNFPDNLPEADVLVHTGDYSFIYKSAPLVKQIEELKKFNDYLGSIKQNYRIIFYTSGNHDKIFEKEPKLAKKLLTNAIVLNDKSFVFEGIKFYGTPSQPEFANWYFNHSLEERIIKYAAIPDDTNVLLTHCPPEGILDLVSSIAYSAGERVGCSRLRWEIENRIKPQLHCYGHIYENNGIKEINGIKYSNACIMDDYYKPTGAYNLITFTE